MEDFFEKYKENRVKRAIDAFTEERKHHDPLGSYTGVPKQKGDKPVQDSDDI